MPDDQKITQPHADLNKQTQPDPELPREDTVHLPTGYQRIYIWPLVPKAALDVLLVRNNIFGSLENAGRAGKPISKIVEWREDPEDPSGN